MSTSLLLSLLGVAIAVSAFLRTIQADRRAALIRVQESFCSLEQQNRRRMLYEAAEAFGPTWPEHVTDDELRQINQALASFELMGYLV